jgi:hypothetical protein
MALTIKRNGFGQVEPNHLSAQRTGQIYAQLPANKDIEVLENGMFAKYDYAKNEVNFDGEGEFMLVLNEVKLYDTLRETYKDFAMEKKNYLNGEMVPRLFKTNVGDIYTTNCVGAANVSGKAEYAGIELAEKDQVSPNAQGFLAKDGDGSIVFEVVKVYTMADGQPAVKLMRIK